jgi:hypothetical protein
MTKLFWNELWTGAVKLIAFPDWIFDGNKPALNRAEQSVFSVGCRIANQSKNNCRFCISLRDLQIATGYKQRENVSAALRGLVAKGFIKPYGVRKWKEPQTYEICCPVTGQGLASSSTNYKHWVKLRTALHRNRDSYFYFPSETLDRLDKIEGATFSILLAIAFLARLHGREFEVKAAELRDLAGVDTKTLNASVEATRENWAFFGFTDTTRRTVQVIILDPASGKSLDVLEAEAWAQEEAERQLRYQRNREKNGKHTPIYLLAWVMWALQIEFEHAAGGELKAVCPKCRNQRTCRKNFQLNVFKGPHGVFRCRDCMNGGSGMTLVTGQGVSLTEAMLKLEVIARQEPACVARATELLKDYGADGRYKAA